MSWNGKLLAQLTPEIQLVEESQPLTQPVCDPSPFSIPPRAGRASVRSAVGWEADSQGCHLPVVKWGCQKLRGQKKMEIRYWIHECSEAAVAAIAGT